MNDKVAIIADVHANLEALKSVLIDIKRQNIQKIYSLGDTIGLGNSPSECLNLMIENNIEMVAGNAEEYLILGADCFSYLKNNMGRYNNVLWTKEQLNKEQIDILTKLPHTIELNIGGKKVALCHFPIDVRYDYAGVWKYDGKNAQYFFDTNTPNDIRFILPQTPPIVSANNDPLFGGKNINDYDVIIYGHYHFHKYHKIKNIEFYSLNGTGVAIDTKSIYYVLELIDGKLNVSRKSVDYDFEKLYQELDSIDYPNKKTFERYIRKI